MWQYVKVGISFYLQRRGELTTSRKVSILFIIYTFSNRWLFHFYCRNIMTHLVGLYLICYILYRIWIFYTINMTRRQTQISWNIYRCVRLCERAERASFENLHIFLSLYTSLCKLIPKKHDRILWGPLGSCPLCPLLNPALGCVRVYNVLTAKPAW